MINVIPTFTKYTNTKKSTKQNEREELQWWSSGKKNLNCGRTLKKKQNPKHIKPKLNLYIIQVKLQNRTTNMKKLNLYQNWNL